MSNGEFLWLIIEDTGNTKKFWDFLCILFFAIKYVEMKTILEWIVTLDNSSIHSSRTTIKTIEKINFNWMFLPAYSPLLAPLERFFRAVKNRLRMNLQENVIWLNKLSERMKFIIQLRIYIKD